MTKDELLKRRWKVMRQDESCPFDIGVIITDGIYSTKGTVGEINVWALSRSPLFKELRWFDDRLITDMPKYLIYKDGCSRSGEVIEAVKYFSFPCVLVKNEGDMPLAHLLNLLPATEQQFIDYTESIMLNRECL